MLISTTLVVLASLLQPPTDTAATLDSVASAVRTLGAAHGGSVWPGFRPDTIPLLFALPGRGRVLYGWRGAPPTGFSPTPGGALRQDASTLGAASTGASVDGRAVAQVAVDGMDPASLVAVAFHEAFHVFQGAARRDDRRFGRGENAFYVSSYPIFDAEHEAAIALEGRLLGAALDATSPEKRRALAREFVAVRRARHARVIPEIALFDQASEMNEGLAQYAQLSALALVAAHGPAGWRASAERQRAAERARLDALTTDVRQSFRLRYYATGPAVARLLDALGGPRWKTRVADDNLSLQDALALASGLDDGAEAARRRAEARLDATGELARARERVARLQTLRRRQVDSALARPGLTLVLRADSLASRDFNSCGFDPQNHLQVTPTERLQTRWWRPCGGASTSAELNVPSVHDARAGTVRAVIGPERDVVLTVDGRAVTLRDGDTLPLAAKVKLTSPRATVETARADLWRSGDTLTVRPRP